MNKTAMIYIPSLLDYSKLKYIPSINNKKDTNIHIKLQNKYK